MREYEAKAWSTLLQRGVCTAEAISKFSNIPVTRVYETLENLERLGLVVVQRTRPKKYSVVSVDSLNYLIEEKKKRMKNEIEKSEKILKEIKNIVPRPMEVPEEEERDTVWIFRGRENILRRINEAVFNAKREVLIFSDDLSWYDRIEKTIKNRTSSGIPVKILININEYTINTIKKALSIGVRIRGWDMRNLMGALIDGENLYLVSKLPRQGVNEDDYYGVPGNDSLFSYSCLVTNNPIIIKMFSTYYDSFWWRGENPEKTFLHIKWSSNTC